MFEYISDRTVTKSFRSRSRRGAATGGHPLGTRGRGTGAAKNTENN